MKPLDVTLLSEPQLELLAMILKAIDRKLPEEALGRQMHLGNLHWKERQANQ